MGAVWLFLSLFLAPLIYAAVFLGTDGILNFICADAYYYLTTAERSSSLFSLTFDGTLVTNGFHPFWQIICYVLTKTVTGLESQIWALFILNALLAALGLYLLLSALYRSTRSSVALFFLVPGFFVLLAPYFEMYSLAVWRLVNGMETSLELVFWGLLLNWLCRRFPVSAHEPRTPDEIGLGQTLWLGVMAAGLVSARLDNLVLLAVLPLLYLGGKIRWSRLGLVMGLTVAPFLIFAAYSHLHGLPLIPVSAAMKSTSWWQSFTWNLSMSLQQFFPFTTDVFGYKFFPDGGLRAPMLLPILAAFGFILVWAGRGVLKTGRAGLGTAQGWPLVIALAMTLKLSYYGVFVIFTNQGFWYYLCPMLVCSFLLARGFIKNKPSRPVALTVGTLFMIIYLFSAWQIGRFTHENRWLPHLLMQAGNRELVSERVRAASPSGKYVDMSDAIYSHFLPLPSVSGTGLAIDSDIYRIATTGSADHLTTYTRLFNTFISRGYTVALHSFSAHSGKPPWRNVIRAEIIQNDKLATLYYLKPVPMP